MNIKNIDGLELLNNLKINSIDLILTDPPYIISKNSGMEKFKNDINNGKNLEKTEQEWNEYKIKHSLNSDKFKENYLKYGNTSGKKFSFSTDYGEWDNDFTIDILEKFIKEYYRVLKKGGTCIIFFDIWKMSFLKEILEKYKFKQFRLIEWVKTNAVPLNSKINYLSNSKEYAIVCVKNKKETFNSHYDNGIYHYPIQGGKNRFHPTQKNLKLFEELIKKHSKENEIVLDTFLGSGTTAIACKNTQRKFIGSELNKDYFNKIMKFFS